MGSMFDALRKYDVGLIGIKPFASGTIFTSGGTPDSATKQEDDERARLAIRYVLCCDVMHCTIPGLITVDQVKNAAAAVRERRQFDLAETRRLEQIVRGDVGQPAPYLPVAARLAMGIEEQKWSERRADCPSQ